MKYPVLKTFQDKDTRAVYNVGGTYETSDLERAAYLQELGYLGADKPSRRSRTSKEGGRDEPGQVESTDNDSEKGRG